MPEKTAFPLEITADRIKRSELFFDLAEEDLLAIAKYCREKNFRDGDFVLMEGEPADDLYIVERGKLALEKKIQIGRHTTPRNATIGYVGPGKMAGFSSLTSPFVYSTSAVCVEPTRAILVNGEQIRAYLDQPLLAAPATCQAAAERPFRS